MNGDPGTVAEVVRLLRHDQLDGAFGLQRLAEITHLPTGTASGQLETVNVPAGGSTATRVAAGAETVLHVVTGQVRLKWGPALAGETEAGPGATVLVPAGTAFRADNPHPSAPLQFILVRGG